MLYDVFEVMIYKAVCLTPNEVLYIKQNICTWLADEKSDGAPRVKMTGVDGGGDRTPSGKSSSGY